MSMPAVVAELCAHLRGSENAEWLTEKGQAGQMCPRCVWGAVWDQRRGQMARMAARRAKRKAGIVERERVRQRDRKPAPTGAGLYR
jgi:hypothetical protein